MNIFSVIRRATHRTEPFHSIFLHEALMESSSGDETLFDQFWSLAVNNDPEWPRPDHPKIKAEDTIGRMRVDLTIIDDEAMLCLGIEVKTHDASTRDGQLADYQCGLEKKYRGYTVRMGYLTPLNRERAGDQAARLHSVAEFRRFATAGHPEAVHLSWLDVANIEWPGGGDLWRQHQTYVREVVCRPRTQNLRGLDAFFVPEAVEDFFAAIPVSGAGPTGGVIDLSRVIDPGALADAFRILIESRSSREDRPRRDDFDRSLRDAFLTSDAGAIHAGLFALAEQYPRVWVKGRKNYGLRVAHPDHRSGVSICTSDGAMKLRVGQPR